MKVIFGSIITGARGRLGGLVMSANASGPYVKAFAAPVNRATFAQQTARARLASLGAPWKALSGAQRTAWWTYAQDPTNARTDSLGNSYNLNGWQMYCALNVNLQLVGRTIITAPPALGIPGAPTIGSLVITAPGTGSNTQAITVASFGSDDAIFELNFSRSSSAVVMNQRRFKFVLGVQNGSLTASTSLGDLQSQFGVIQAGSFWECKVYRQSTSGVRGTAVSATVTAV